MLRKLYLIACGKKDSLACGERCTYFAQGERDLFGCGVKIIIFTCKDNEVNCSKISSVPITYLESGHVIEL